MDVISYGLLLVIATVALTVFYLMVAYWDDLRAIYRCISLKTVLTGNVGKCFGSAQGPSCHETDLGFIYGWCDDGDNYGPLPGSKSGPYGSYCSQWSWSKDQCPPYQCADLGKERKLKSVERCGTMPQKWGWCADRGVERAMLGTPCGPRDGNCDAWIWEAKKCPTGCPQPPAPESESVPVPEPEPQDPWKPYMGKTIRIQAKAKPDGQICHLQWSGRKGGITGVGENERVAKFDCQEGQRGDPFMLKQSSTGTYQLVDKNNCKLQWSSRKGGSEGVGSKEHIAKFDCGASTGDPLIIEGPPTNARFYSKIGGKKCGLEWSGTRGHATGVGSLERIAKFDCGSKGDLMTVTK